MARGYLGKISAIVSANTGNYVRGLDESARRTAAFAKTIQSDLRNASRDASKSIDGILTPLQKVERALQNARSQRLSFRGFEGAIRTVEDLRKRIGTLELGDRELAVRVSGLRSVDALNKAIEGLKQEDVDLAVRVGGVDGIRRLRQEVKEVDGQVINVKTGRSAENLDFLISKFQALSAQRIQQVQIAVETAQFDRAEAAFKRTVSIAQGIAAPLGAAVQQLTTLSAGVQTAFGPALQIAQRAVDNLGKTIEANGRISDNTFDRTAQRVERTAQAINRLAEASRIASSAATGVELGFVAPRVRSELTASAAARNAAAESADPSRFAPQVQQLSRLNNLVVQYQAEVEQRTALGLDTTQAQDRLDKIILTTRRTREELEQQIRGFTIVDAPQATKGLGLFGSQAGTDEEQSLARARTVSAAFEKLPSSAQAGLRGLAGIASRVADGVQAGTSNAVQLNAVLDRLSRQISVTIDTKAAEDRVKALDTLLGRVFGPDNISNINALEQSIQKLSLANQLNLGEAVQEFRDAIASGKDYEEQLKRLLAIQDRLSVAQAIEALPEGSDARRRLQERFDREGLGATAPANGIANATQAAADAQAQLAVQIGVVGTELDVLRSRAQAFEGIRAGAEEADAEIRQVEARIAALNKQVSRRARDATAERNLRAPVAQSVDEILERLKSQAVTVGNLPQNFESRLRDLFDKQDEAGKRAVARELDLYARGGFGGDLSPGIEGLLGGRSLGSPQEMSDSLNKPRDRLTDQAGLFTNLREIKELEDRLTSLRANRVDVPLGADTEELDRKIAEKEAQLAALQEQAASAAAAPPTPPAPPPPSIDAEVDAAKQRTDLFGLPVDDSVRRLGVLQGALNSVKGQVDQLPIPLQARFVPLLSQAEAEFQRLKNSGSATAAEIAKAARNVENLKNSVTRAADAGKILSASQVKAGADTRRALGEVEAAGGLLLKIGADAAGPAAGAYDNLASATKRFAEAGTLGTAAARKELERLQVEAAKAAEATGRISFGAALKQIQRGGDVATGAFNNTGLAAQQALFIVDDFFSVTGDLTQRVRAIGNNITQLGLIVGQTQGLFVGLGVSLGLQVTAQLIKFFNAGVDGSDKIKALNESLQRQKTIVDQLAESFRNLGRSFTLDAFQAGAKDAEQFRREIQTLRQEQEKLLREQAAALDPDVLSERGIQAARRRELETTRDPGAAALITREIEQSRIRERAAVEAAFRRTPADPAALRLRLAEGVAAQERARQAAAGDLAPKIAEREAEAARQAFLDRTPVPQSARQAEDLARQRLDELAERRRGFAFGGFVNVKESRFVDAEARRVAEELTALQRDRLVEEGNAQVAVIEKLREFALGVQQSIAEIDEAISRGVPGAAQFAASLQDSARAAEQAEQEFRDAGQALRDAISLPTATSEERDQRSDQIAAAQGRQDAARRQIDLAQRQAGALVQERLNFSLQTAARTDRAGPALQTLQSSQGFANEYAGLTAQLQSAIEREKFARERLSTSNTAATQAQLAAAQAATQLATAAAEAAIKINEGFDRFRSSIQAFVQQTQQAADEAQRRVNQAGGVGGPPLADLERNRDRAERNLEADQEFARGIENQLKAALAGLANDPEFQRQSARLNQLRNDAEAAAAQAIQTNIPEDPKITAARTAEIAKAEQTLDAIRKRAQEGIQKQVEAELRLKAARDRQEEFRRAEQDRRQPVGDAVRGLDIVGGARERARNELRQRQVDIEAARRGRRDLLVEGIAPGQGEDVNVARQQLEAAQQRLEQERFRQRNFANLLDPTLRARNEASDREDRARQSLSAAQVFAGELPDFGTDLPGGVQSVEEAQQAIDKARELLQKVSLLGSNAKPEDFAELAKIFPETLTDVFGEVDLNNLAAESFSGFDSNTPQDARKVAAAEIARAQQELNAFVNAGRPGVEAARAEAERQEEALKKANSGLDEVLGGVGLDRQDFNLSKEDEKLAERLKAAEQAVAAAQQAFDQVNEPFANLEKNEREAAEARRRAIEDITDLGLSDQRKFARGLEDNLGLVQAQAEGFLGIGDRQAALDSLNNAQNNLARQNAPLFAQFSDEVANAVLQGPSRAALQASDASTSEGQRELNRLLRGEDSARDVNFVELQKQSTFLQSIDTGIAGLRQQLGLAD